MFDLPSGPGVRVDTFGYSGYKTSAAFNSLLAKVIVHSPGAEWADVVRKASRTLREFRIGGVDTNIPFLAAVLAHPDFAANRISTGFIDTHIAALVVAATSEVVRWRRCPKATTMRRFRSAVESAHRSGGLRRGTGAAARHHRHHRCRRRRARASRPADCRARIHEDGASGQCAAWRQGDEDRKRRRHHVDAGRGHPVPRAAGA